MDRHDRAVQVLVAGQQHLDLQVADLVLEGFERLLYFGMDRGIGRLLRQLEKDRQVFLLPFQPFPFLYRLFNVGLFLDDGAGGPAVAPETRLGYPCLDLP
jgi:hypothetical protein